MHVAKKFFLVSFLVSCCWLIANHVGDKHEPVESFIIKKPVKKEKKSLNKIKKELTQVFGDEVSCVPRLHKRVAKVQQIALRELSNYIESGKKSFCSHANKDQTQACLRASQEFADKMEAFCDACDEYLKHLKVL